MTIFYLTREGRALYADRKEKQVETKHLVTFRGKVTLTKNRDAIMPKGGNTHRFTLFNDEQPPRIVQLDYSLDFLANLGAKIPERYIRLDNAIVSGFLTWSYTFVTNNWDESVIMPGPSLDASSLRNLYDSCSRP